MAGGVNVAIVLGHVGKDPEVRFTPSGQAVANFSVATNESWTDKQNQRQERVEWHRIVVWGKLAELCGEYLRKGRQVYVQGRIQTREWTKQGSEEKNYTTEIVAQNVQFLGPKGGGGGGGQKPESETGGGETPPGGEPENDLPF